MSRSWNLVADIGGTNARFALEDIASGELVRERSYTVADYAHFPGVLERYLGDIGADGVDASALRRACLAVASPVDGDEVLFTNSPWVLDRRVLSQRLSLPVCVINDFVAVGHAIAALDEDDWLPLGGAAPRAQSPIGVLGAGTGLGVCAIIPVGERLHVLDGEGGHVDFAPVSEEEIAVLGVLTARFGRVSAERVLSGDGIVNVYGALSALAGSESVHTTPAAITDAALRGHEPIARRTLEMFCRVLGSTAGNLALTLGARGGIYIAGGIAPRFADFLAASDFRARFEAKGRFSAYLRDVPVKLVTRKNLGLKGAARYLAVRDDT